MQRIKTRFLAIGKDLDGFQHVAGKLLREEIAVPALLWRIWDTAVKFSPWMNREQGGLVFRHEELIIRLYDFRQQGKSPRMMILRDGVMPSKLDLLRVSNRIVVVWDHDLAVDAVVEHLDQVDVEAAQLGLLIDGVRETRDIVYGADATFQTAEIFLPLPPNTSIEEFLEIWDHPEILEYAEIRGTVWVFRKGYRRQVEAIIDEAHLEAERKAMKKRGYTAN